MDEVLDEVEQDSSFYNESGGGITLSGGECQLQADDELLPYNALRGRPSAESLARLRAIIDEAFGRSGKSSRSNELAE